MKSAALRICRRVDCQNSVTGRAAYCSRRCSAWVRNHRYYGSLNGRLHKRAAASRYFQRHRNNIYERKVARFVRYESEILHKVSHETLRELVNPFGGRADSTPLELAMQGARRLARVQHDWNGRRQGDSSVGRPYYMPSKEGQLVLGIWHSDVGGWTPVAGPIDASRFVKPATPALVSTQKEKLKNELRREVESNRRRT